ncbi:hypothetical protein PVPAM_000042600, partial [Plasmodium vivax]
MDYSELKKNYQFLGKILDLYDKLDQLVDENDKNKDILNLCDIYDTFNADLTTEKKNTCKKLLRNLFLCSDLNSNNFINCCSNLYVWLYFEIKKSGISNDIVQKIFELPKFREKGVIKYIYCPYDTFNDEKHDPEDLLKLSIFNNNADTFQSMLKDSEKSKDCHLKKYVYECVNIYNKINDTNSFPYDCNTSQHKNACEIIKVFNSLYMSYIFKKEGISDEFPELSSDTHLKYMEECPVVETVSHPVPEETQQDPPTTGGASTALSAMVGIPPFLALIYK